MSDSSAQRTRLLGLLLLGMAVVLVGPRLRPDAGSDRASCPREFTQTRMAATLLWARPDVRPVGGISSTADLDPDRIRLLDGAADEPTCARIAAAIPDTLKPLGLPAPRFTAFYEIGDLYVAPILPSVSAREIEAERRGEPVDEKVAVTFVFDRDLNVLAAVEN